MDGLKIYGKTEILSLVDLREGETRLGENVQVLASLDQLKHSSANFVLLGIPEDIGVRANYGIAGAATAWQPALKALLNIQSNSFLEGSELLVLGHFSFSDPSPLNLENLQQSVSKIDEQIYPVIRTIIEAGKVPIVIGGGHNNAYPILKGLSLALKKPVNTLNIDAHADLRPTTGRHSGNGFSYAIADGFLKHYAIFGLHKNYNNSAILNNIATNPNINVVFFDDLLHNPFTGALNSPDPIPHAFQQLLSLQTETNPDAETGLEIDLDCIENVLSSAFTPSGFTINEVRKIILNTTKKFAYMHLCEGAAQLANGRESAGTAKTIAYLITDFIRAQS